MSWLHDVIDKPINRKMMQLGLAVNKISWVDGSQECQQDIQIAWLCRVPKIIIKFSNRSIQLVRVNIVVSNYITV